MKARNVILLGVVVACVGVAVEVLFQRRVTLDAETHLLAWIDGKRTLFPSDFAYQEKMLREHVSKGVTKFEVTDADWRHVSFRVWNSEGKAFSVSVYTSADDWAAQAHPVR